MIRIRRIHSSSLPADRQRLEQVKEIFRQNFPSIGDYAEKIPKLLDDPFRYGYRATVLVSEGPGGRTTGFALVLCFPEINSALLDFIVTRRDMRGGGLGSALYEAVREYCLAIGVRGLYMEVLPDDPDVVHDEAELAENRKRLRFYEHYGVRPIAGTEFETPIDDSPAPYLLFDGLGRAEPLRRAEARAAARLVLRRKYGDVVKPDYIERVVESFIDDPVRMRDPRYVRKTDEPRAIVPGRLQKSFVMVASGAHEIHHVRDRGYVERPARVGALTEAVNALGLFSSAPARHFGEKPILAVHDRDFVNYLKAVCRTLQSSRSSNPVYPYVFPIRRPDRRPKELAVRAGYYCIDTFTPLDQNAYQAARGAADVAMTAAEELLAGRRVAYAVCRPPGHHAERRVFGGFCYFNNAAIAARVLGRHGKVAVLDIDYHHGNGTQDIFYNDDGVLTVSIHGHPNVAYPYFSGFADETGAGPGAGYNRNFPLPDRTAEPAYLETLEKAMRLVERFKPLVLVVSLGLDTMRGDPTGSFLLTARSMETIGARLAAPGLPLLIVQEGGYNIRNLKRGAAALFTGVAKAMGDSPF